MGLFYQRLLLNDIKPNSSSSVRLEVHCIAPVIARKALY